MESWTLTVGLLICVDFSSEWLPNVIYLIKWLGFSRFVFMINGSPEHNECYLYLNVIQIATPNFLLFERETNLSAESGETRWNHTVCCCAVVLLPIRSSGELSMWICCSEIRSRMTRCFLVVSNHCDVDNLCFVASNEGQGGVGGPRLFLFSAFRILLKLLLKLSLKLSTWVMISNFVLEFDPFLDARNTIYFYHFCDYDRMHRIFLIPFELLKDPECLNDAIKST